MVMCTDRLNMTIAVDNQAVTNAVGNVSGYRCMFYCKSNSRQFDPGPVPFFRVD